MPIQLPQAEQEIQQAFEDYWLANAAAAIGATSAPEIRWEGVGEASLPPESEPYVRHSMTIASGNQVAFGESPGARRYREIGLITVQVFTPINNSDLRNARALAQVAVDAYRGVETDGGVEFTNARASRIGTSGAWFQYNVLIDFNYDSFQ